MNTPARRPLGPVLLLALAAGAMFHPAPGRAAPFAAGTGPRAIKLSSFLFAKSVPAGTLQLEVTNDTKQEGGASIGRLPSGMTTAAALKAIDGASSDQGCLHLLKTFTFVGGVDQVQPGQTAGATVLLRPGSYAVVKADGGPPAVRFFTVAGAAGAAMQSPAPAASLQLAEMRIVGLPKHLSAGAVTIEATNVGMQVHNLSLIRLAAGKTEGDVLKALTGNSQPKWAQDAGSVAMLSPHQSTTVTLRLAPGNYVALCNMPDVTRKGYVPHAAEGMIAAFTVS